MTKKSPRENPSSKVLYRKYRPTKLADVVGQEQITSTLEQSLAQGKVAHAYLFIGPRGTGKTSVARIFAHAVNGFDYQVEDHYLDIIEIDAASNTGVDNIRELREKAIIAPTKGKYKVYIIDEVHMLTKSASNALLKTLEEPPAHVIFIMATTDAHKVPITISSRTQVHTFKLATPDTMKQHLTKIAQAENIPITDEALDLIVRRGGGSFRDSLSLLDQIMSLSDQEITLPMLTDALGLPQDQTISELIEQYLSHDQQNLTKSLQDLLNTGIKPEVIASELMIKVISQPRPELLPLLAKLTEVQPPFSEAKLLLALVLSDAPTIQSPTNQTLKTPRTAPKPISPVQEPTSAPKNAESTPKSVPPKDPDPDPKPAKSPVKAPESKKPPEKPTNFDWNRFVESTHDLSSVVYNELRKITYTFVENTLHLYPERDFSKNILNKPNNSQIITGALPEGTELIIHNASEHPKPDDSTLSQISDIMGNIQEVKGEMPF